MLSKRKKIKGLRIELWMHHVEHVTTTPSFKKTVPSESQTSRIGQNTWHILGDTSRQCVVEHRRILQCIVGDFSRHHGELVETDCQYRVDQSWQTVASFVGLRGIASCWSGTLGDRLGYRLGPLALETRDQGTTHR